MANKKKSTAKTMKRKVAKPAPKSRTRKLDSKARVKRSSKPAKKIPAKSVAKTQRAASSIKVPAKLSTKTPLKKLVTETYPKPALSSLASTLRPAARHLTRPAPPKMKTKVRSTRPAQISPALAAERRAIRMGHVPQFNYMKAPDIESAFEVGDIVEVFCDHEKNGERVRGWVKGTVVQVDYKMVAVQFRSNVFLTDGWMVPDRILWYPLTSDQIRALASGKKAAKKEIPDY